MNIKIKFAGIALTGALALTACGGAAEAPATTTAPVTAPSAGISLKSTPTPTPTPIVEAPESEGIIDLSKEPAGSWPEGVTGKVDTMTGEFMGEVGDTVYINDEETGAGLNVTLNAVDYVTKKGEDTVLALFSFDVKNNSAEPIEMNSPMSGGGWSYVSEDGEEETFYDNQKVFTTDILSNYSSETLDCFCSGPYKAKTKNSGLTNYFVLPEIDGEIVYYSQDGMRYASFEIPDGPVNTDDPVIKQIHKNAAADGGYLFTD